MLPVMYDVNGNPYEAIPPAIPTFTAVVDDGEEWTTEIPRFRLMHGVMDEVAEGVAKAGEFRIDGLPPITSAADEPIVMGVLARAKMREYRLPKEENPDRPLLCKSDDAYEGIGQPGGECRVCPMAKERCDFIHEFIVEVVMPEGLQLARWSLKRTGEYAARRIHSYIAAKGFGGFAISVTSRKKGQRPREYFRPEVSVLSQIPEGVKFTDWNNL